MTQNRSNVVSGMPMKQKIIGVVFAIILIVIIWQVRNLFKGESATPSPPSTTASATSPNGPVQPAQPQAPTPAVLPSVQPTLTPQQAEAMAQQQQEMQTRYLAALNELQILKLERDIAETNKEIMAAKLEIVTAEKGIVDILKPAPIVPAGTYAQNLGGAPTPIQPKPEPQKPAPAPEVNYVVISVSQIQQKWGAILGYQGTLYNVSIGDILPPDGSTVIAINKSGVVLEKDAIKRKISLVPII